MSKALWSRFNNPASPDAVLADPGFVLAGTR